MTSATVQPGATLKVYRINDSRANEIGAHDDEADINTEQDIEDLQAPVGAGESLYWELELPTTGDEDMDLALIVRTPPHPNGGFQIVSGRSGVFLGFNYGADYYNAPAGIFRSQQPGDLLGFGTVQARGILANGETPGLLKFQLAIAVPGMLVAVVVGYTNGDHTFYRYQGNEWVEAAQVEEIGHQVLEGFWRPVGTLPAIYVHSHEEPYEEVGTTTDLGDSFTWANAILDPNQPPGIQDIGINDFFGPDCTGRLYASYLTVNPNSLYYSTDGFVTATLVTDFALSNEGLVNQGTRCIAVHPTDYNRIAVMARDFDGTNFLGDALVYVTTDRGVTWNKRIAKVDYGGSNFNLRGSLVWLASGRLTCVLASDDIDTLSTLYSDDDGVTWTETIQRTNLDTNSDPTTASYVITPRNLYDKMLSCFSYIDSSAGVHGELWRSRDGNTFTTINLPDVWPVQISSAAYDPQSDILWVALWEDVTGVFTGRGLYKLQSPLTATAADWELMDSPEHDSVGGLDRIAIDSMSWIPAVTP